MSHEAGYVQRGEARFCGSLDGRSVLEEKLHNLDAVLLTGDVQWGEAIQSTGVNLGGEKIL